MAGYLFYHTADSAQDRIWRDTMKLWGEDQAETYIIGLHQHIEKLSKHKALWRRLPLNLTVPSDLEMEVWFSRYAHHYIIFRQLADGRIGIITILHEKMDLPVRLADDLLRMTRQNDK